MYYVDLTLLKEDELACPSSTPDLSNTVVPQLNEHSVSTFRENPATTTVTPSKLDRTLTNKDDFFYQV